MLCHCESVRFISCHCYTLFTSSNKFFKNVKHYLMEESYQQPKRRFCSTFPVQYVFIIRRMIMSNLLELLSIWKLLDENCILLRQTSFCTKKYDCMMNTEKIFSFMPVVNSSVTTGWSFLLPVISVIISSNTINT